MAAVISFAFPKQATVAGSATGMLIRLNNREPRTIAHELGHTLGLKDNFFLGVV